MPSEKRCNAAREVTGSRLTNIEINIQYCGLSSYDKFILSNSIEKVLRTHNVSIEEGWKVFKDELEDIALEYLVNSATAFCLYKDWKSNKNK